MKRIYILFLGLIMIPLLSISQETYPKPILLDGDSLILITPKQVHLINYQSEYLNGQKRLLTEYQKKIELLNKSLLKTEETEADLRNTLKNRSDKLDEYEIQIQELTDTVNNQNTKLKGLRITRWIYLGIGAGAGGYLTYQFIKLVQV